MNKNFSIYSILAFPLAFIGLPIYVHIANFYINQFALNISLIGILIFISRFVDFIQDPIIGEICDKLVKKGISRKKIIYLNAPFLSAAFYFLFNPPNFSQFQIAIWFLCFLILVYTFFSVITINYYAIAAEIAVDYNSRIKITAKREFVGLLGILSASILPSIIAIFYKTTLENSLAILSFYFLPILIIFTFIFNKFLKIEKIEIRQNYEKTQSQIKDFFATLKIIFSNKKFKNLALIFLINSIAVSLPASTFLFFVEDVLLAKSETGIFLLTYFFSAALAMPFWNFSAQKFGKNNAWILSIFLSIFIFFLAFFLNSQNYQLFYLICFFSGLMLGADLAIPPSILADIVNENQVSKSKISSYFAIWNMTSKFALAFASGFALIFLGFSGFRKADFAQDQSLIYLSLIYALIPCLIKIIVIASLLINKNLNYENYEKKL